MVRNTGNFAWAAMVGKYFIGSLHTLHGASQSRGVAALGKANANATVEFQPVAEN
jgi:hypothetical protein